MNFRPSEPIKQSYQNVARRPPFGPTNEKKIKNTPELCKKQLDDSIINMTNLTYIDSNN